MNISILLVGLLVGQASSRPVPPRTELARSQDSVGCFPLSIQELGAEDRVQSMAGDRILTVSTCSDPPTDLWAGLASERPELWAPTLARFLPGTKSHPWTFLVGGPTFVGTKACVYSLPRRADGSIAMDGAFAWRIEPWACLRLPKRLVGSCDYRLAELEWLDSGQLQVRLATSDQLEECEFRAELTWPS